jgi:DnaJ-class molecular chaperone
MANFLEIDEARRTLGLGETATLKEIKGAYRRLAHCYHPDQHNKGGERNQEAMKKLNWAYKLLENYCRDHKYSFRQEDVSRTYPDEEYIRNWRENWFNSI